MGLFPLRRSKVLNAASSVCGVVKLFLRYENLKQGKKMRSTLRFAWRGLPLLALAMTLVACSSQASPIIEQEPTAEAIGLFYYEADLPLDLVTHGIEEVDGLQVHDISFESPMGGRVPGYLYVPPGEGPFAGFVIMAGHRDLVRGHSARYAHTGAVVAVISVPWARRSDAVPGRQDFTFTPQDSTEQVQYIVDTKRLLDILVSRPDVDPQRIGVLGGSYGGGMAALLSGVETRVVAYAFIVGDGGLDEHFRPQVQDDSGGERWLAAMAPISPLLFVGRAAPAQLLYLNGLQDPNVRREDAERFQAAGSEPKTIRWYDRGHDLGEEAQIFMASWFASIIGINADLYVW